MKEELLASAVRKQIAYLEGLLQELSESPDKTGDVLDRIRQVEKQLYSLRAKITF